MVGRRASRLPASTTSLEEVVVQRLVSGSAPGSEPSQQQQLAAVAGATTQTARRRSSATLDGRRLSLAVQQQQQQQQHEQPQEQQQQQQRRPSGTAKSAVAMPPTTAAASNATVALDRIERMAEEVAAMNDTLQGVTKTLERSSPPASAVTRRVAHGEAIDAMILASVQDLEAEHTAVRGERDGPGSRRADGGSGRVDPRKSAQVHSTVREIRTTIRRLDRVFYEVATGDKRRQLAATKISALCRGFLARRRCWRMHAALGQWRTRRCTLLLLYMDQFAAREAFLQKQIVRLELERRGALLRRVIAEIRDVALMNLPMRRRRLEEAERRFRIKQRALQVLVLGAWKECALGHRSRKRVMADVKARHSAARHRLEALERFDVITAEMVHEEFLKDNIRVVRTRHPHSVLKTFFSLLRELEYIPMREKTALAVAHARRRLLTRVWGAWLPLFRTAQVDKAIAKVNERRTLERFDKHHNLRRIDAHYRRTHLRKHLVAWARYGQRIRRVRKLFEDNTRANLGQLVRRWGARAKYQRALRARAVEDWRATCRRIFQTPFRAWYVFAAQRRANRQAKESICVAYQRRQRRHTKYTFFRLWKHQILFGNIEGIHSKLHLLRSLEDQKRLCLGLEDNARLYQENIRALGETIRELEAKVIDKQRELEELHAATQVTRFSVHTAEQSIARVQGMLEAVRQIHPGTLERIEKMFKENPLLTQDLKDVVSLHVQRRQEVLAKIALDDAELEIQQAIEPTGAESPTRGGRVMSRDDQLLLHRVKWVLSRLDLQGHRHNQQHQQSPEHSMMPTTATLRTMDQLCGLFEFIRDGETAGLSPDNDPSHPRPPIDKVPSSPAGFEDPGDVVQRADLVDGNRTWHGFLEALTVKFARERMRLIKERLVTRAAEMNNELEDLKTNPQIYNAYSGSAHPRG